jgi:hypothetical protein
MVWMGPRYDPTYVLTLMAVASLFPISQQPIATILVGLNLHGRFAAFNVIASIVGFVGSLVALHWLHWELLGLVAVALGVSNIVSLWIAIDTCRRLSIPVHEYFVRAYTGPLACAVPFCLGLLAVGGIFDGQAGLTLGVSALLSVGLLVPLYWRVVPIPMREQLVQTLTTKLSALRLAFSA